MKTSAARQLEFSRERREGHGPPVWLFAATAVLGIFVFVIALAETNLWLHYLIDGGEYVSLVGLVFIAAAGVALHRKHRLVASLPLVGPWLLFPLITQGDQIIDNLSIVPMRIITHVLLAAILATPVGVIVLAARSAVLSRRVTARTPLLALVPGMRPLAEGRAREGTAMLAASLLICEMWLAMQYLGALMVGALAIMALAVLWWGSMSPSRGTGPALPRRARSERSALVLLLVGVAMSFGLYVGYKNRPGAYQGSPSFLMDPHQQNSGYRIDRIAVPTGPLILPASTDSLQSAFTGYGRTLRRMLDGYYVLDRNYTWHFHNELFLRNTPLLPDYRAVGLRRIAEARAFRIEADGAAAAARASLADDNPIAALLDDVRAYASFNFERAGRIESMSARFEKSAAGLQHAAHLYEGEGKVLGMVLSDILVKHSRVIESPAAAACTADFARQAREMFDIYASRVVGF